MAYTNALNTVWNNAHNGMRVPINDTGVPGAPTALSAALSEWVEGSVNKAVKNTWLQYYTFDALDQPDVDTGTLDLLRCTNFVIKDMLYGFNGDARYKRPGDMMSFRGYPTGIVLSNSLILEYGTTNNIWDFTGVLTPSATSQTVLSTNVELQYKLPYNFEYTMLFTYPDGSSVTLEVMIQSGKTKTSHYRLIGDTIWIPLQNSRVYFSMGLTGLTGTQSASVSYSSIIQAPYYGNLPLTSVDAVEGDYNPINPPEQYSLGFSYYEPQIIDINCFVLNCNEIEETLLFDGNNGIQAELYGVVGQSLDVGATIWKDIAGTVPADPGTYLWAQYSETITTVEDKQLVGPTMTVVVQSSYTFSMRAIITPKPGFENVWYYLSLKHIESNAFTTPVLFNGVGSVIAIPAGNYEIYIQTNFDFEFTVEVEDIVRNYIVSSEDVVLSPVAVNGVVYTISQYVYISNGKITEIYKNIQGSAGPGCWLNSVCR